MAERARSARIDTVLECVDLDATVSFLTRELGLRIDSISPADSPATITLSGAGASIRVVRSERDVGAHLAVAVPAHRAGETLLAPNGTRIDLVADGTELNVPANVPSMSIVRAPVRDDGFGVGRAGMEYRDLLPDRWGGRFIASHIRIPGGGEVPDSVHFHRIRFQLIFCARGWVDLVYEDQGPPFRLVAGDCVVQPPEIRHRVLHASPALEVIEIGCPAVHDTFIEHELALPTEVVDRERSFGGQRFVHDRAAEAVWEPWLLEGLRSRRAGVAAATADLAGVRVVDAASAPTAGPRWLHHDGEFVFDVVLHGSAVLRIDDRSGVRTEPIGTRDAIAIPPGARWQWGEWSEDFEFLEVTLPADPVTVDPST